MRDHDDWRELPLDPQVRRFIDATRQAHLEERQALVRFAPMLCRCARWYDWRSPGPPQEDCFLHATVMFDRGEPV